MSKKCGFFGAECYDLIHYMARILHAMHAKVLIVDQSDDRSLETSVPLPSGYRIELDHVVDYRGVDFAGRYLLRYDRDYDFILIYFGHKGQRFVEVDWLFLIDNADVRITGSIDDMAPFYEKMLKSTDESRADEGFMPGYPVNIYMSPVRINTQYAKLKVPLENWDMVILEQDDIIMRVLCQHNGVFKFNGLSGGYKDLLYRIFVSIYGPFSEKKAKQAFKEAERGR